MTSKDCMGYIWNGIQLGLALALLIGPIFFALIQAGVERGFRAGAALAAGIWISDFLYIVAVIWGGSYLEPILANEAVIRWLGIFGSVILIGIGAGTLFAPPPNIKFIPEISVRRVPYHLLWLKGFAINTFNPFTVFFWISVMTGVVLPQELSPADTTFFFAGILGAIVLTDVLKVLLAKRIRSLFQQMHLIWLRRIAGAAILAFGLVLMARVLWQYN